MIETTGAGSEDAGGRARRPASASVVGVVVVVEDVEGLVAAAAAVVAVGDGSGIFTSPGEARPDVKAHHPGGAAADGAMTDVAGLGPGPAPAQYRCDRPHPARSRAAPAS